tara:strand:+ start:348 stop:677 length:330 start_codon:yes stop_codon:yes gene_type:complete
MANDFKMVTSENIGTSPATIYTAPASKTTIVLGCDISNLTAGTILMDVEVYDASATRTVMLVKDAPIPTGASIKVIDGQKLVLETGDYIRLTSDTSTSADAVCSILEDV